MSDDSKRAELPIDVGFFIETLERLVRINSVNPGLEAGGAGEIEIASETARLLRSLGLEVSIVGLEERPSVVGTLHGTGGGRSLMLNGHYDTVGIAGMKEALEPRVQDGRMHGRGTYDMKGGLAACIGAVEALGRSGKELRGDLLVSAVADEEVASIGTRSVIEHVWTDGVVVTEPTELQLCLAHKGFVWMEARARGRAAHGSEYEVGIDANLELAPALVGLRRLRNELLDGPADDLLGHPSLHVGRLEGGVGWSTYAAEATLRVERRTLPEENPGEVREALEGAIRGSDHPRVEVATILERPAFRVREGSSLVEALKGALEDTLGRPAAVRGANYWMDAAFFSRAGSDTVVMGPSGGGAHTSEEWVDLESVVSVAATLADVAVRYCG